MSPQPIHDDIAQHMARVVAAGQLLTAPRCPHCSAVAKAVSWWPGTDLPRAIELRHEAGCPAPDDLSEVD